MISKKPIKKEWLKNCFESHGDGMGMAWATKGKLHVRKGYFEFEPFWRDYKKISRYTHGIHARTATQGKISPGNCHPFYITRDVCMFHNGCISNDIVPNHRIKSDTKLLVERVLKPLAEFGHGIFKSLAVLGLLKSIGGWSKFAFLFSNGESYIVNMKEGEMEGKKTWFSNGSYRYELR